METYCVLVHLLGARREIYLPLLVLSTFYNNSKFCLPVSFPLSSWPQGTEAHRDV